MQTTDLIARLSGPAPTAPRTGAATRLLLPLLVGVAVSFAAMVAWLGIRPDLSDAMATGSYWMKFAYTGVLAVALYALTARLGRPGGRSIGAALVSTVPVVAVVALALVELAASPSSHRTHMIFGASHDVCPWRIIALSLPILVGAGVGLRRLAPTRLVLAGCAAGLLAGAAGAWVYAFHCDESTAPFVAVWYTLGVAAVGATGATLGKWLLRW